MIAQKENSTGIFAWFALAVVVICLFVAMTVSSSAEPIGKSGAEITQVVQHLDSADSLKTILVTFGNQYHLAEEQWMNALSILTFLLFVVSVVAMVLAGMLIGLSRRLRRQDRQRPI